MYEPTGFSLEIFKSRYAFTESESWADACPRGLGGSPSVYKWHFGNCRKKVEVE